MKKLIKAVKLWRHPKFKNRTFTGRYDRRVKKNKEIDQSFYLISNDEKETRIDFESPAAAKDAKWVLS